ncbi:DUF1624 domain-containing protein [Rhizobium sp. KVB221]|uniref:DUF1624 domain-containing protein n=2 Tax=Rhizobium setariae TaxID=2801340 RepID=A0A937CN53_9HYPH|nr:DUF1624 domain-containing protein [Rhizobium setariae]
MLPVNTGSATKPRFQWLDILRGASLLAMASYHLLWDLADFGYLAADFPSSGWPKIYARAIASTFLFLAGFSLVLAHGKGIRWRSFWIRFAKVAAAAVLVTVATYFAIPQGFIFFGILHAIAVSSVIGLLFLRVPPALTAVIAAIIIAIPQIWRFEIFDAPWFWWLGLSTSTRISFDYVPLLPWLGPVLLGIAVGRLDATQRLLRQNTLGISATNRFKTTLAFFGRHSLVFYLIHQPILISVVYAFSLIVPAPEPDRPAIYLRSCAISCKDSGSAEFCARFCDCTLERLEQEKLLVPLQSGAISAADNERLSGIALECTSESETRAP